MKRLIILLYGLIGSAYAQDFEILFTRQVNNNDNIYAIHASDGTLRSITEHPRKDSSPMMSPDGETIVFASERVGWWKIWILDLKTNTSKQLTFESAAAYSPVWSADGRQIIYVSGRNGNQQIYAMDREGKNIIQWTKGTEHILPSFGSDGWIYYNSRDKGEYQIWRMKPGGADQQQITQTKGDKLMPQLSPDHQSLLYYGNEAGNFEIYTMNIDDLEVNRLTNHPLMDIRPRFSPDGEWIVFERGNKRDNQQIYIMRKDGNDLRQLTHSFYNYSPSFVVSK